MDFLNLIWTEFGVRAAFSFIFILSVIVFVHEMGHYLIARYNDVRVDVFSIGFGPELFGWDGKNGTRWKVGALPLGGYVKMFGDANAASQPGAEIREMSEEEKRVSFHHKRLGQRAAVVFGGPLANFVLAIVILAGLFATVGQRITPADITMVKPGSAAEAAGIQPGDVVLRIDDRKIERFEDIQRIVRKSAGVPLKIVVRRGDEEISLLATPHAIEKIDRFGTVQRYGELGVGRTGVIFVRLDPLTATWVATSETFKLTAATVKAIGQMIAGTRGSEDLGGPIRIAKVAGQVAEDGMITVFWFMAVLSINLGLINLFPVPMLDGGHLLFYAFEAVRGRPLGERAQEYGFRIGIAMVVTLMVFATWNDLVQLKVVDFFVKLFS
ncbi:MAG: RIP metalloprotease RseP [Alphaproteobacteria bacterium]